MNVKYETSQGGTMFRTLTHHAETHVDYPWVRLSDWQKQLLCGDECRFGNDAHLYVIDSIDYVDNYWTRMDDTMHVRRVGTDQIITVKRRECIPELKYCPECGLPRTSGMRKCHA